MTWFLTRATAKLPSANIMLIIINLWIVVREALQGRITDSREDSMLVYIDLSGYCSPSGNNAGYYIAKTTPGLLK